MAGQDIYIGTMVNNLNTKIDAMNLLMDNMVTRLVNIGEGISQQVAMLKIKESDTKVIDITKTSVCTSTNNTTVNTSIKSFKSYASGKARFKLPPMPISISSGSGSFGSASLVISARVLVNSTPTAFTGSVTLVGGAAGTLTVSPVDVTVALNDTVDVQISIAATNMSGGSINYNVNVNGGAICYELVDIINNGAFA